MMQLFEIHTHTHTHKMNVCVAWLSITQALKIRDCVCSYMFEWKLMFAPSLTSSTHHCCLYDLNLRATIGNDVERYHLVTGERAQYLGINTARSVDLVPRARGLSFLIASIFFSEKGHVQLGGRRRRRKRCLKFQERSGKWSSRRTAKWMKLEIIVELLGSSRSMVMNFKWYQALWLYIFP